MPVYRYKAVNNAGDVAAGELEAANEGEIVDRLRDQGLMPMQVVAAASGSLAAQKAGPRRRWFTPKHVTRNQVLAFTAELATLLRAGLPLDRALEILIGLAEAPPVARLLQKIRDDVRGGKSLSQALDVHREIFSRFYVNIVRAGEAGGALGTVLTRLADTMERNKELRESVKSALIYPTILIFVAVASVMILLIYVVPQFEQTFAQAGKALPLPTQIVIFAGTLLRKWWWAILVFVVAAVWLFRRRLRRPDVRFRWDQRLLRWPLIGDLVAKVEVARLTRTLATLLANGVTLLAGLSIVKETMGNSVLALALDGVVTRLREGKGFGRPLAETGLYPRLATQMILVGEESGRLEEMLNRVADVYDREVATAIRRFLAILEPVLIVGLAVMVICIVLSIWLGIIGMTELVQGGRRSP
jgi:general secretion pathway protein F